MKNKAAGAWMRSAQLVTGSLIAVSIAACEKGDRTYSLLSGTEAFQQSATYKPRKIDVLWIIDNSGSMKSSQDNLTANFSSFISRFQSLNYDFRMGVNASDAWLGRFNPSRIGLRRLRDGAGTNRSGVFVMDKNTPDIENVFLLNASLGINGTGDERAFSSIEDTLNEVANSDFRRDDAYLAIIILSDEDDFSATTSTHLNNNYNDSRLIPVSYYKNYLDGKVGADNWTVNAITILDDACKSQLNAQSSGRVIGKRYVELSEISGGVQTSLCGDFGTSLKLISDLLIEVSSTFKLDREPIPASIRVLVDGRAISENRDNGWSYDPATLTLTFHGTAIPGDGQSVVINFDPMAPKN